MRCTGLYSASTSGVSIAYLPYLLSFFVGCAPASYEVTRASFRYAKDSRARKAQARRFTFLWLDDTTWSDVRPRGRSNSIITRCPLVRRQLVLSDAPVTFVFRSQKRRRSYCLLFLYQSERNNPNKFIGDLL